MARISPEGLERIREGRRRYYADPRNRAKVAAESRARHQDAATRDAMMQPLLAARQAWTPERRRAQSQKMMRLWTPERRRAWGLLMRDEVQAGRRLRKRAEPDGVVAGVQPSPPGDSGGNVEVAAGGKA